MSSVMVQQPRPQQSRRRISVGYLRGLRRADIAGDVELVAIGHSTCRAATWINACPSSRTAGVDIDGFSSVSLHHHGGEFRRMISPLPASVSPSLLSGAVLSAHGLLVVLLLPSASAPSARHLAVPAVAHALQTVEDARAVVRSLRRSATKLDDHVVGRVRVAAHRPRWLPRPRLVFGGPRAYSGRTRCAGAAPWQPEGRG